MLQHITSVEWFLTYPRNPLVPVYVWFFKNFQNCGWLKSQEKHAGAVRDLVLCKTNM
jgi:hypothetical protein